MLLMISVHIVALTAFERSMVNTTLRFFSCQAERESLWQAYIYIQKTILNSNKTLQATVIFLLHEAKNVDVDLRVTVWALKIVSTAA